ncbi:carbonic anhydrase [Williamwhitmania taraxaci]|uniref:Carbonic anhydrase n=1 Tax=Williamwhitmania taraxaci TaxID=1640674 RepID=A0A1G6KCT8_9BACT|nr:carbonic anhydrase [Williamwhitmania taraxaci]SDC28810.1 carbonic anhydrase [Williamwhitmania taraxaci]
MKSAKYNNIFKLNKEWVSRKNKENENYFSDFSESQSPDFLYIGCSDSRVPANKITGLEIGDLFVHRNIANIVSNNDLNVQSIIQYAVEQLNVKHIVVCGHYGCGGVQAALKQESFGLLDNWLRNIRDVYRMHYCELEKLPNIDVKINRLVELNVVEQCKNIIKTSYVQKSYIQKGYPTVHGWIYNMQNGELVDMDIDFKTILADVQRVYRLE